MAVIQKRNRGGRRGFGRGLGLIHLYTQYITQLGECQGLFLGPGICSKISPPSEYGEKEVMNLRGKSVALVLALGVLLLLAQALSTGEPAAYAVAALLGLLAVMVRTTFHMPKSEE